MKILILTQNENIYLPQAIYDVCKSLNGDIKCIITAPSMSTHGGFFKGILKNIKLFGLLGTFIILFRICFNKLFSFLINFSLWNSTKFYSIKNVSNIFKIPYYSIFKVDSHNFINLINTYEPDLLISMSCPQIIKKNIRDKFALGCINVHGSPLPKYRGLLPSFWVLKNSEDFTAVTVHELEKKLDDGAILGQKFITIDKINETWDSLVKKTKKEGAKLLIDVVNQIRENRHQKAPNNELDATYYSYPDSKDRKTFLKNGNKFFNSLF